MATTTNYSWTTPDNTAYVKDGASAIRTLGSSVDTTLFTALGGAYPGLRLVKKQTIGSGVASVTVTGAFSSTYDNYLIMVAGGAASTASNLALTLGSSTTDYYSAGIYVAYNSATVFGFNNNNTANFGNAVSMQTNNLTGGFSLFSPNLAKPTGFTLQTFEPTTTGIALWRNGFHNASTQHTAFTLTTGSGTITGGDICVYGYGKS